MADFTMPSLGADMVEGTLVEWMVAPGDQVHSGDVIAVVETTKGAIETEVFVSGTVGGLRVKVGETVPVGTVLATIIGAQDEGHPVESVPELTVSTHQEMRPVAVAARKLTAVAASGVVRASPAARKLAAEQGLELVDISGSGPGGAVTLTDVQAESEKKQVELTQRHVRSGFDPASMRQGIAAAMARSKKEIPHYYLSTQIDMSRAQQWLAEENARRKISDRLLQVVLPLKAMALALRKVPELNGFYSEGVFNPSERIHVGIAIALRGGGLVAPALHDVDRKSLDELIGELNDLITRARSGTLRSSEMSDPTITLTNMGETGVEGIFGIIYPPQVAILGLGKVMNRPWVANGQVEARPVMLASLSADHRVSDGHRGAVFLNMLDKLLQTPEVL